MEPLLDVCKQIGMLRTRHVLHSSLNRVLVHVDQFLEDASRLHETFEGKLFCCLGREGIGNHQLSEAQLDGQMAEVQRTYLRRYRHCHSLRNEITAEAHKLLFEMPLQSPEEENQSSRKLKCAMTKLSAAL